MVVRVVRTVIGFLRCERTKAVATKFKLLIFSGKKFSLIRANEHEICVLIARDEELGVLSRTKKTTTTNDAARTHPALLPRITTI